MVVCIESFKIEVREHSNTCNALIERVQTAIKSNNNHADTMWPFRIKQVIPMLGFSNT